VAAKLHTVGCSDDRDLRGFVQGVLGHDPAAADIAADRHNETPGRDDLTGLDSSGRYEFDGLARQQFVAGSNLQCFGLKHSPSSGRRNPT